MKKQRKGVGPRRRVPGLRSDATDAEVVRWATKHDVFQRLDAGVSELVEDHHDLERLLEDSLFQGNTTQLNMRLPRGMKAVLSRLARQRTTDTTTLARIWIAERIRKEIKTSRAIQRR